MWLDYNLIVEQIAAQVTGLARVDEAASLDALSRGGVIPSPSAWVVPIADQVAGPQGMGVGRILSSRFGVILIARNVADPKGGEAIQTLRTWREAVYAALNRWRPDTCWSPILYQRGSLWTIREATYWWIDEYQTQLGLQ